MSMSARIDRPSSTQKRALSESPNSTPLLERSGRSATLNLVVTILLILLGCAALSIDVPLARWFGSQKLPSFLKKTSDLAEVFGHGTGVAAILLSVWVLAPQQRRRLPRIICCAYLSGLVADGMKLLVARGRPYKTDLSSVTNVWGTFRGWLPLLSTGNAGQSFTSAHTATAVGLALGLAWLFPRGKWLFAGFALLVALQRMAGPYHFCSDTLWGAAIGWLIGSAFLPGGWFGPAMDQLEQRQAAA